MHFGEPLIALTLAAGCGDEKDSGAPEPDGDADTDADSDADTDADDSGGDDSGETGHSGDTGESGDTDESGDTGESGDSGETGDSGDSVDTAPDHTGDTTIPGETGAPVVWSTWTGWEVFELGNGTSPGDRWCVLYWAASGSETSARCDGCAFAFDIAFTYDEGASTDDGTCEGAGIAEDMAWTYAYTADYAGYGPYLLVYYYGYWNPWAHASFDEGTGELTYRQGVVDYYAGGGYYYTQYLHGDATLE